MFTSSFRVHMESGFVFSPPTPTLLPGKTEVFSFTKDDSPATGAVGVMTYELFHMQQRCSTKLIDIMFSVPYDYNFYANWLGIGVFPKEVACDHELFDLMYNKDEQGFVRQKAYGAGIAYKGGPGSVDIRACMNDEGKAIIKMELYDSMGL